MSRTQFRKLTKIKYEEAAFSELIMKQEKVSKGRTLNMDPDLKWLII